MSTRRKSVMRAASALLLALALVIPVACESDDGNGNGNGGADTAGGDDTSGAPTDITVITDVGEVERTLFRATVKDFQTRIEHPDAVCYLLFNPYPEDYNQFVADDSG
ncbi:MAG: hypothetical protein M5T61_20495, partial [Acidimicrobiia bacterium]|nr:hypothetical protein [Acidimicrobiia bacterium]